jgi:voltage-gated potassium channel
MALQQDNRPKNSRWRNQLYTIIYEADTPAGKLFDVVLLISIVLSVLIVSLESIPAVRAEYGQLLRAMEWFFTILFTIEYVMRLICVEHPWRYVRSFYGIIDLLSTFPTYLALLIPGAQTLLVIRVLRLLRIFRVFKMAAYLKEAEGLRRALWASRHKIIVFLAAVLTAVIIIGALIYVIEGEASGFTSIPVGVYWAIVTLSTVGYGDVAPITPLGQILASVVMLLGFGIIAVPTGIVSLELVRPTNNPISNTICNKCGRVGHDADAVFCKYCSAELLSSSG